MTKRLTKLTNILLQQHSAVILCLHISLTLTSLLFAWLLRYEFVFTNKYVVLNAAPLLVLFRLVAMSRYNLLHGHWRYTGVDDAADMVKATLLGSCAFFFVLRWVLQVTAFPKSIYIIECVLTGCFLGAVRVGFRVIAEASMKISPGNPRKQVLIIGAGFAGQMIIRELRGGSSDYWVIGCLDDDPKKIGLRVLGKPVLGTVNQLSEIVQSHSVDEVLIAVPSATGTQMRRFVDACQAANVRFSTVPSLHDLISGKARIHQLREVDLDDLLGREPIKIDLELVRSVVHNQVVMVTGAAGSIGSEICRQILQYYPVKLVCLDQSETGLFYLQMELGSANVVYCVADFANPEMMKQIFSAHQVQIVFHAAAYKHVPLMEANPREALKNNVLGLSDLLDVADAASCQAFILISSDKAVNPTNIMGATKRIGELMLSSRPQSRMRCVSVRFGNVLGSQGSVVPVFQKQLAEEKSITVTHPEITRFFMTIREAVSLVLQAAAIGNHGDILVLDMGLPVRILDLAKTLIRLSGKSEREIQIVYTGLRPGEKLYEELFYENEQILRTSCEKIHRTQATTISWLELERWLASVRERLFDYSELEIRQAVHSIVPKFTFESTVFPVPSKPAGAPEICLIQPSPMLAEASSDD